MLNADATRCYNRGTHPHLWSAACPTSRSSSIIPPSYLGRVEEQKQFIAALQDVLKQPAAETLPYIILLYGDGGMV